MTTIVKFQGMPTKVQELYDALALLKNVETLAIDGPTVGGYWFFNIYGNKNISVIYNENKPDEYGFSLIDEDCSPFDYPCNDCRCMYLPHLIKYVNLILK